MWPILLTSQLGKCLSVKRDVKTSVPLKAGNNFHCLYNVYCYLPFLCTHSNPWPEVTEIWKPVHPSLELNPFIIKSCWITFAGSTRSWTKPGKNKLLWHLTIFCQSDLSSEHYSSFRGQTSSLIPSISLLFRGYVLSGTGSRSLLNSYGP